MAIKIKLNQDVKTPRGLKKAGSIISLESDVNNIPLDRFWRFRLKDSAIDNSIEVITDKKEAPSEESKTNKKKKSK